MRFRLCRLLFTLSLSSAAVQTDVRQYLFSPNNRPVRSTRNIVFCSRNGSPPFPLFVYTYTRPSCTPSFLDEKLTINFFPDTCCPRYISISNGSCGFYSDVSKTLLVFQIRNRDVYRNHFCFNRKHFN